LNPVARRRRHAQTGLAAAFFFALAATVLLLRFPPDRYSFYPRCPIHTYLHLLCPGCGTTRALAALLHGRLREAFHLNALLIVAVLPAAAVYTVAAIASLIRLPRSSEFHWPRLPGPQRPWIYAGLALAASFSILRNLPS
jgi:hypothetical protein